MINFDVKFDIMWIGKCFVTELTLVGWCSWFVSNDSSFFIFIIWCRFRIFNRPKFLDNLEKCFKLSTNFSVFNQSMKSEIQEVTLAENKIIPKNFLLWIS